MPRNAVSVAEESVQRARDAYRRIDGQLTDARRAGGRAMLKARDLGVPRSRLANLWSTSLSQVDRMIAEARLSEGR